MSAKLKRKCENHNECSNKNIENRTAAEIENSKKRLCSDVVQISNCENQQDEVQAVQPSNTTTTTTITTSSTQNSILLEALERIVDLQNELDDFEQDLDESELFYQALSEADDTQPEDYSLYEDEHEQQQEEQQQMQHEYEALGFAMCAREALLFLQREGISQDSLLYKALRMRLLGQADGIIPI